MENGMEGSTDSRNRCCSAYTVAAFCEEVGRPVIPGPAAGAVIGVVGALLASVAELTVRVSEHHLSVDRESWQTVAEKARDLKNRFLRFADEDVAMTAALAGGEGPACARKQMAAPAKIASALVKLLRAVEGITERVHESVQADVRAIAHLGRGAADAIFEIEKSDMEWAGGGDGQLQNRIAEWREQAHAAADRILHKARENGWEK
jgi:formiminotetrahydrofolate cyclodeaminase